MHKIRFISSVLLFSFFLFSCEQPPSHIDEQFGNGIILTRDSSVAFFKGMTFFPEGSDKDTSKLKTKLNLYHYKPYKAKAQLIHSFGIIKNWPEEWETYLAQSNDLIGFSLANTKKSRINKEEGIYIYNLTTGKTNKIEETGQTFWISPDGKLIIYHLYDEESESYNLYGYDLEKESRSIYEEGQPKIRNVEWLRDGEAALLLTEEKDSTIVVEFK